MGSVLSGVPSAQSRDKPLIFLSPTQRPVARDGASFALSHQSRTFSVLVEPFNLAMLRPHLISLISYTRAVTPSGNVSYDMS